MKDKLNELAVKYNVTIEKITQQYGAEVKRLQDKGVAFNIEQTAFYAIMNSYRRQRAYAGKPKRETTTLYGFVTGDSGIWDKAEQVRREVKNYIEKYGLQAALEAQKIDGDNNILDQRQKIYGKDNPNYLKPLSPTLHVLERTLSGFFRKNGDTPYKYATLQTSDNLLARGWDDVKFYVPCQVTVIVKEEDNEFFTLSSSSSEENRSVFKGLKEDMDIKKIIDTTIGEHSVINKEGETVTIPSKWCKISEIEAKHEVTKDAWDRKIFVKGIVAWINTDRPTAIGSIKMGLMDPDNEEDLVVVEIPKQLRIDFGELSEVYVFGKTRRNKFRDQETHELVDGDVIIQATGIFVVTPIQDDATSTEEVEMPKIKGWID